MQPILIVAWLIISLMLRSASLSALLQSSRTPSLVNEPTIPLLPAGTPNRPDPRLPSFRINVQLGLYKARQILGFDVALTKIVSCTPDRLPSSNITDFTDIGLQIYIPTGPSHGKIGMLDGQHGRWGTWNTNFHRTRPFNTEIDDLMVLQSVLPVEQVDAFEYLDQDEGPWESVVVCSGFLFRDSRPFWTFVKPAERNPRFTVVTTFGGVLFKRPYFTYPCLQQLPGSGLAANLTDFEMDFLDQVNTTSRLSSADQAHSVAGLGATPVVLPSDASSVVDVTNANPEHAASD